jgi:hypothetical protein
VNGTRNIMECSRERSVRKWILFGGVWSGDIAQRGKSGGQVQRIIFWPCASVSGAGYSGILRNPES